MSTHTLSVLVENSPGVLARIASLFSRRGYNIDSLAVGPTEDPNVSRMTIVVNVEGHALSQVIQLTVKRNDPYLTPLAAQAAAPAMAQISAAVRNLSLTVTSTFAFVMVVGIKRTDAT